MTTKAELVVGLCAGCFVVGVYVGSTGRPASQALTAPVASPVAAAVAPTAPVMSWSSPAGAQAVDQALRDEDAQEAQWKLEKQASEARQAAEDARDAAQRTELLQEAQGLAPAPMQTCVPNYSGGMTCQ